MSEPGRGFLHSLRPEPALHQLPPSTSIRMRRSPRLKTPEQTASGIASRRCARTFSPRLNLHRFSMSFFPVHPPSRVNRAILPIARGTLAPTTEILPPYLSNHANASPLADGFTFSCLPIPTSIGSAG